MANTRAQTGFWSWSVLKSIQAEMVPYIQSAHDLHTAEMNGIKSAFREPCMARMAPATSCYWLTAMCVAPKFLESD